MVVDQATVRRTVLVTATGTPSTSASTVTSPSSSEPCTTRTSSTSGPRGGSGVHRAGFGPQRRRRHRTDLAPPRPPARTADCRRDFADWWGGPHSDPIRPEDELVRGTGRNAAPSTNSRAQTPALPPGTWGWIAGAPSFSARTREHAASAIHSWSSWMSRSVIRPTDRPASSRVAAGGSRRQFDSAAEERPQPPALADPRATPGWRSSSGSKGPTTAGDAKTLSVGSRPSRSRRSSRPLARPDSLYPNEHGSLGSPFRGRWEWTLDGRRQLSSHPGVPAGPG